MPVLSRRLCTCFATVIWLMKSRSAISAFVNPLADEPQDAPGDVEAFYGHLVKHVDGAMACPSTSHHLRECHESDTQAG